MGWDSSVGIATHYGLDGQGIEYQWRRNFPNSYRTALGPTQPPLQWVPGLFAGDKATGAWRWPLNPTLGKGKGKILPITGHEGPEGE